MAQRFNEVRKVVRTQSALEKHKRITDASHGMICGAVTQAGTPCKQKTIYNNGRCKWHGGLSTGPKSEDGKLASAANGKLGGRGRKRVADESACPVNQETKVKEGHGYRKVSEKSAFNDVHSASKVSPLDVLKTARATTCRCNDCEKLSAGWTCLAASLGELGKGAPIRPALAIDRVCTAFLPRLPRF